MTVTIVDSSQDSPARQLMAGDRRRPPNRDPTFARLFARFALTGLVAMVIIGVLAFVVVRRTATAGAVRGATRLAQLAGRGVAQPLITPAVLRGEPSALSALDRAVHERILSGTPIVRVKIWTATGRIVYSDAHRLIGSTFALGATELHALHVGGTDSDASDLTRPENRTERGFRRLIEVYVGITGPAHSRLLYEDYERSSTISSNSRRQWLALLPVLGGALLVLYLIQIPLAGSLARRLRDKQKEREALLQRAIEASDLERRRIAADLHDGAVQRLAAVSISLAAAAAIHSAPEDSEPMHRAVADAAAETRETIRELRTLLVDIYPPTLQRSGLLPALQDLVAPLVTTGIDISLDVPSEPQLSDAIEALLYRVAQEAIRNVRTHGDATEVAIEVNIEIQVVRLTIADNGRGFSPAKLSTAPEPGHFGLRLMRDLVDHAGGELLLQSAHGAGTSVQMTVPRR